MKRRTLAELQARALDEWETNTTITEYVMVGDEEIRWPSNRALFLMTFVQTMREAVEEVLLQMVPMLNSFAEGINVMAENLRAMGLTLELEEVSESGHEQVD